VHRFDEKKANLWNVVKEFDTIEKAMKCLIIKQKKEM